MSILTDRYRAALSSGALKEDAAQERAVRAMDALSTELSQYRPGWLFRRAQPRGLYLWGDVGRGKSMLMDLFFETAPVVAKVRVHFNAFMNDVHARIHAERQKRDSSDPIGKVARALASDSLLLCFDEFQVVDVADAMILGRLFEQLISRGVVIVATSNTPPNRLYEGGLNRDLFLPFIAQIERKLDILELSGPVDYRLHRMGGLKVYMTPLSPAIRTAMDAAWLKLTDVRDPRAMTLTVFGRALAVSRAARGVARFSFAELCVAPLAAADYLAIARTFHTVMIDDISVLSPAQRNEARRFVLLIDTLYDEAVKLICSAEGLPEDLYPEGDGNDGFRRTISRLNEMQSEDYLKRGHGVPVQIPQAAAD